MVRLLEQEAALRAELSRLKQRTARQSADLQDQLRQSQAHCLDLQCQLDEVRAQLDWIGFTGVPFAVGDSLLEVLDWLAASWLGRTQ